MKKISSQLILIMISCFLFSTSALGKGEDRLVVKVNGMVCAFCAQGIKKNFGALSEVKNTEVDLDNMTVTLTLNSGKTIPKKTIKKIITESGFKFIKMKKASKK